MAEIECPSFDSEVQRATEGLCGSVDTGSQTPLRLAFYTYSYTDRLQLDVEHVNSDSVSPERRTQIRQAAARYKLRVEAIVSHAELTASLFGEQPLDLMQSIDLACDLGGDVVTFHLGGPVEGVAPEVVWNKTVHAIREAANHGDSRHVRLAIDLGPWPTWIVRNSNDLAKLIDDVGSPTFGVNFDPSYLAIQGIDPVGFVQRFGSRIRHVHVKDHIGKYPQWLHKIPGRGEFDYVSIVKALAEARFDGSLAIECFTDMPLSEACEVGYNTLRLALRQAGISTVS
ncbi:MAG: sugar phosphate isomerase/epimerase [Planctomycetota bacterium]|nr:sugar phosphate isomerase/epimerase [Planctomycetota bacterium]